MHRHPFDRVSHGIEHRHLGKCPYPPSSFRPHGDVLDVQGVGLRGVGDDPVEGDDHRVRVVGDVDLDAGRSSAVVAQCAGDEAGGADRQAVGEVCGGEGEGVVVGV